MPELPEVESIRLQLEKYLHDHQVEKVDVTYKNFEGSPKSLVGGKIKNVRRFGKVLSLDFDNGFSLVIHIKLTGQLIYRGPNLKNPPILSKKVAGGAPGRHTHVIFHLDKKGKLFYNDVRRFGWIKIVKTDEVPKIGFIGKLGPEPLGGLSLEIFEKIISSTKRSIKTLLMDQSKIGGVGNIYANDALNLAKIHPEKPASALKGDETEKLFKAIEKVLKEGLKRGGASELAFVTPDGSEGGYQKYFLVYGREGAKCKNCGGIIKKVWTAGRGTYFCPNCQKK